MQSIFFSECLLICSKICSFVRSICLCFFLILTLSYKRSGNGHILVVPFLSPPDTLFETVSLFENQFTEKAEKNCCSSPPCLVGDLLNNLVVLVDYVFDHVWCKTSVNLVANHCNRCKSARSDTTQAVKRELTVRRSFAYAYAELAFEFVQHFF